MRSADIGRYGSAALRILLVAAVYYGAARIGLLQQLVRDQVTPLWPPTGVALAALLVLGMRVWPGVALGAFLVNVSLGPSAAAVLAITAGNTLAPVCACLMLRKARFRVELDRLRDVLALVFLGALAGMLISSTIGSGALVVSGALEPGEFWPTWSVWWTGDAMGVLVVAPFLLVLRGARWPRRAGPGRWAEGAALVAATVFVTSLATRTPHTTLLFLVFPVLIWAALRFQLAGAAPCALAASTQAILAAAGESGPFAGQDLFSSMVTLQAFNGTTALTALLLAAVITDRNRTYEEIKQVCIRFADMVAEMEPRPESYESPPEPRPGSYEFPPRRLPP
ncbi:MASE1 domain-containing protein [Streptomyces sp. PKU-EA00015]|uniref:MASE1 domain-containing protein n=1 Tax=Streptomyces sp. PKU-EA00015 TaxID=2748326 RepID=UPI0028116FD9|nr:MASE1 domain-containing protein [Streptomyces sp. PKU-EA00015]